MSSPITFHMIVPTQSPRLVIDFLLYCKRRGIENHNRFEWPHLNELYLQAILEATITAEEFLEINGNNKYLMDCIYQIQEEECNHWSNELAFYDPDRPECARIEATYEASCLNRKKVRRFVEAVLEA